ncbi:MAG TPA: ribosome-associated translation inhibitor RaiA [Polyangiaceae bacterium]|nr:ribosome-associated translation inhibitor RaiA [Polyangiaceae bacterium]
MKKIKIRERRVAVSEALQEHVEKRVGFALARFGERIGRVIVRFSTDGGHKCCEIAVDVGKRIVWAEDTDIDLFAAVDHASQRVSRSVARALARDLEAI